MLVLRRQGWALPESAVTPEQAVLGRRQVLRAGAAGLGLAAAGSLLPHAAAAASRPQAAPTSDPRFMVTRPLTPEADATTYNNYYEFGDDKDIWQAAQKLKMAPWSVRFEGMVETPRTVALDDLLRAMPISERILRHRCVEAWAMTVPWTGFPLNSLVAYAKPLASAKYVTFTTAQQPDVMPGLQSAVYPFPYLEAVTIAEAANDLPFIATGLYGKPLDPQNGGPMRLLLPWKYGFKSAKALVTIGFTDKQPVNFWQAINPDEYGFWANVNPAVPHPRWSQASERLIGTGERVPTTIYNGYGDFVSSLYTNLQSEKLYR